MVISNITGKCASNQSYIVSGLMPFMWYGFRVRAFQSKEWNSVYTGTATDEILVITHEDGKMNEKCSNITHIYVYRTWCS